MPQFKNIRVKMKGGKSRMQRVKVLASGKYRFVKNIRRRVTRRSKSRSTRTKTKIRRTKRMVRRYRRKRRGGGKSATRGIFKLARVLSLVVPPIISYKRHHNFADPMLIMTGYNATTGKFEFHRLVEGWGPFVAVSALTHLIPKINGLIRRL